MAEGNWSSEGPGINSGGAYKDGQFENYPAQTSVQGAPDASDLDGLKCSIGVHQETPKVVFDAIKDWVKDWLGL